MLTIIGAIAIFTAPFWHIVFPKQTASISAYKSELNEIVSAKESALEKLRTDYDNGLLTASDYIERNDILVKDLADTETEHEKLIDERVDSERVFGWKTPRLFLIGLGVRLPYLIFSLIISLLIMDRKRESKKLTNGFNFLQVCCWSITSYLMLWCFWYYQDFPIETYWFMFAAISILIGTAAVFFINNYVELKVRANKKYIIAIQILNHFIINITPKFVKDKKEYDDNKWETFKKVSDETR